MLVSEWEFFSDIHEKFILRKELINILKNITEYSKQRFGTDLFSS